MHKYFKLLVLACILGLVGCDLPQHQRIPTSIYVKITFTELTQDSWDDVRVIFQVEKTSKYSVVSVDPSYPSPIEYFIIGLPMSETMPQPLAPASAAPEAARQRGISLLDHVGEGSLSGT